MNKSLRQCGVMVLFAAQFGCAEQLSSLREGVTVQPRINSGVQYYEYNQEAKPQVSPNQFSAPSSSTFSTTSSKLTLSDVMPLINGGVTLFKDRFFLDLDAQYAFNGSASSNYATRAYLPRGFGNSPATQRSAAVVDSEGLIESDFERLEYSFTFGYQLNDHFLLYAGYKRAETVFHNDRFTGRVRGVDPATGNVIAATTGDFFGSTEICLNYDGPFIGAKTAWGISSGPFDGLLTGHFGVAFLDGNQVLGGNVSLKRVDNSVVQLPIGAFGLRSNLSGFQGDSIGWVLGVGWRGLTPYKDLSYSAGVNAYRYDFGGKTASDISEMAVRFDLGLAYSFDI